MDDSEGATLNEDADNEFPQPRRPMRPAVITGIIALVVIVVAGGIFAATRIAGNGANAVPTPTLVPGSNLFYVQTSPAWGDFFVDGQKLAHIPVDPSVDLPLQLSPGVHEVTWQADPFKQQCTIIVPPSISETKCLANEPVQVMKGPNKGLSAYLIAFTASFNDLTPAQQQPLFQAAQKALDMLQSSGTVQPGEQYADLNAPQFTATATTTLRATLRYQLDTNAGSSSPCAGQFVGELSGCSLSGQNCHLFCDIDQAQPEQSIKATPNRWNVFGVINSSWTYTTLNGQVLAQNQPDEVDNLGYEYLIYLYVTYSNGQWHVVTKNPDPKAGFIVTAPSCEAANNLVTQTEYGVYSNISPPSISNGSVGWDTTYGANLAAGCLLNAIAQVPQNNPATPVPSPPPFAHCLYRFGVLVALDSAAHSLWPTLPLADAYEQGIARSIQAS